MSLSAMTATVAEANLKRGPIEAAGDNRCQGQQTFIGSE
jgi:hypothetical protein